MPQGAQRYDSARRDGFWHLQPKDDTAVGILRSPWERMWRKEKRGLRAKPWQTLRSWMEEEALAKEI